MSLRSASVPYICARCLRSSRTVPNYQRHAITRTFTASPPYYNHGTPENNAAKPAQEEQEKGALSRRLEQMSEEALETGGRSARKAVAEAGFDEDLRKQLEERIAKASFRNEHASAIAQANLPSGAGRGTRDIAGAQVWTGTEAVEDTALRMLTDSHKPLRGKAGARPGMVRTPKKVDTGRPSKSTGVQHGQKLVNARDKSSHYALAKDGSMSEEEREKFRKEMRARFNADARSVPATISGLQELANQRIEDAIARGQFKNIPRGMKMERDYNASSPFIDTTEYFMNKIIQKQEIVPPWIEKQQELVSSVTKFRARLRNDWRRHAARTISSYGGNIDVQVRRAEEFAAAEMIVNPPKMKTETLNALDAQGHLSQITLAGELKTTPDPTAGEHEITEEDIKIIETIVEPAGDGPPPPPEPAASIDVRVERPPEPTVKPAPYPFRDPVWLSVEQSYFEHTIKHLNSITRSYNLIAPALAKKPYFSLDRELDSMYRDVAPTVANEILQRAMAPKVKVTTSAAQSGDGVLGAISARDKAKVWDEDQGKHYGFKEFWKDLFAKA